MDEKERQQVKEIRKKIVGRALLRYLKEHPDEGLHLKFQKEQQ